MSSSVSGSSSSGAFMKARKTGSSSCSVVSARSAAGRFSSGKPSTRRCRSAFVVIPIFSAIGALVVHADIENFESLRRVIDVEEDAEVADTPPVFCHRCMFKLQRAAATGILCQFEDRRANASCFRIGQRHECFACLAREDSLIHRPLQAALMKDLVCGDTITDPNLSARLQESREVLRVCKLGQCLLNFAVALQIKDDCGWPSAPRDDDVLPVTLQVIEYAVQPRNLLSTHGMVALSL